MSMFAPGDRVRCVDTREYAGIRSGREITLMANFDYTVNEIRAETISLKNIPYYWDKDRFVLNNNDWDD